MLILLQSPDQQLSCGAKMHQIESIDLDGCLKDFMSFLMRRAQ